MHRDESEQIREEMARIRGELTTDVGLVVQQAKDSTDWRTIVRRYPWWCFGAAAAVGFMLVPAKAQPAKIQRNFPEPVPPDSRTGAVDRTFQAKMSRRQSSGLLNEILSTAAKTVLRSAVSLATTKLEQTLASAVRTPPTTNTEQPVQDRPS